jgi:hypothetical protein
MNTEAQARSPLAASIVALLALVVVSALVGAEPAPPDGSLGPAQGPAPSLEPVDAVAAQLDALARNDDPYPGAGIEVTWAFASPANRAATGPLERFRDLFVNRAYAPMVDHLDARFSETRRTGEAALVGVILTGADGTERGYLFQLSQQRTDACAGCWMTDAVMPMPLGSGPRPPPPQAI